jgi:biotin synthase-like enzyme
MIKRRMVAEKWDEFARAAFRGRHIQSMQRREMRRAFYAGADSVLFGVVVALTPDREPTDQDVQLLEDLHDELREFAQLMKEGRA